MKRSISVPLIFLGTLGGLTYCQQRCDVTADIEVQAKTDYYATLNDCQRDWGTEAPNCQEIQNTKPINWLHSASSGPATTYFSGTDRAPSSASIHDGKGYAYSGPRYYWYRTENGGYPMALDPDGKTRALKDSRVPESGAKFASQSVSTRTTLPKHMTASEGVLRGGFGQIGCNISGGG